jgi:hypothetical protein
MDSGLGKSKRNRAVSTREERFRAMDAAVFRTITAEDWRAMFARHPAELQANPLPAQIRRGMALAGVGARRAFFAAGVSREF